VLDVAEKKESNGTEAIPINVAKANAVLRPVEEEAQKIDEELNQVNKHLTSICESTLVLRGPLATALANPALTGQGIIDLLTGMNGAAGRNNSGGPC